MYSQSSAAPDSEASFDSASSQSQDELAIALDGLDPLGDADRGVIDLAADELLRAIAHAPARCPRSTVAPMTPWGPVDRYIIDRELGRGGMGTVYAATDRLLNRVVALKVLDAAGNTGDAHHHARLLREAQVAAQVEHERIARVYDVGTHEGFAFVAMEYVQGGTLRQWLRQRHVPVPQILDIATQIAEGLAELHAKGVIHRDLKPENVMLTAHGGIKLVDFGLARNAVAMPGEPGSPSCTLMLDGSSVATASGTPGYMAPERCTGQPLDARVDIFSLGVIIYELVMGERPFRGATAGAIMMATLCGAPMLRDGLWARIPQRLRDHTARMLSADPLDRFADGASALAALRELTGEMAHHRTSLPETMSKAPTELAMPLAPARRSRRIKTRQLAHAGTAVAAGLLVYSILPSRPPIARPAPDQAIIDVGAIAVGRDDVEVQRECRELGSGCNLEVLQRETPRVSVTIPPFLIDKYEVTNQDFAAMLNELTNQLTVDEDEQDHYPRYVRFNQGIGQPEPLLDLHKVHRSIEYDEHRRFRARPGYENLPVALVSWYGAKLFCDTRGKRLPTENEWEAAARGRNDRHYPWGNEPPRCGQVVIKNDGRGPMMVFGACSTGDLPVSPVGLAIQDVSPEGVHDLAGNVSEWTDSPFIPGNRAAGFDHAPRDALRVIRGGSWGGSPLARATGRAARSPSVMGRNLGFRCASNVKYAQP